MTASTYTRLKTDALFVIRVGHAWALPKGTVVSFLPPAPSCVTGAPNELHVSAPDAGGRPWRGWIAASTPFERVSDAEGTASRSVWKSVTHFALSPLDELRERVTLTVPRDGWDRRERPVKPWTLFEWLCVFGKEKRTSLEAVLKQFRKTIPKPSDVLVQKLVKVVLNEDVSDGKIAKTRARLNKDAALLKALRDAEHQKENTVKKTAKKSRRSAAPRQPRANSMPKTVGELLLALKIPALRPAATKLVRGTASHKDLVALRATINLAADKARQRGKKSLASQLSSQNRLVRRLERAGR